ncbi:hypothetical protein ACLVWQ_02990 [Streptomyces sp. CWNU-52B]
MEKVQLLVAHDAPPAPPLVVLDPMPPGFDGRTAPDRLRPSGTRQAAG